MISDYASLIGTGLLMLAFLVFGFLDILDNPIIKMLLIAGLVFLVVNVIIVKSKEDDTNDKDDKQKNLP